MNRHSQDPLFPRQARTTEELATQIDEAAQVLRRDELAASKSSSTRLLMLGFSLAMAAQVGCSYSPFSPTAVYGGPPVRPSVSATPGQSAPPGTSSPQPHTP